MDEDKLITDLYLVSRPHMRLHTPEAAYKMVSDCGSQKLRELVTSHDVITKDSDSNSDGKASSVQSTNENNNI